MSTQVSKKSQESAWINGRESALIERLIVDALKEDIGTGDITGDSVVPEACISTASLVLKEPAVVAGLEIFEMVLQKCHEEIHFQARSVDGERITSVPYCLARIEGNARALLRAERTALNLIQRMSGIATFTQEFVKKAHAFGIEILDTRKTTPGLRVIEKLAVRTGGGTNHRFGLYDLIMIKDNHRAIAGGVKPAVEQARLKQPNAKIEVEVNNLEQLKEALELKVERVMLDNMTPAQIKESVSIAAGRTYLEVSGGVNLANIEEYLIPGVNGISVGALTHSVKSIDISLEFED